MIIIPNKILLLSLYMVLLYKTIGDVNIVDTDLNTPLFREILQDFPPCKLGLNNIGGKLVYVLYNIIYIIYT